MQIELQDNDMVYQDQFEVQQRTLQIDILKQIFTASNEKIIQIILIFKEDQDKFQSFKQLHRKLKTNIVTQFNNVLLKKIENLLRTFMLEKQFFQTKTQKATLWFISKIIIEEKIIQPSQDFQKVIYEMFKNLTSMEDFIDLSKYIRYFTSRNKQKSESVSKHLFFLYYQKQKQIADDQLKFKQIYEKLSLEDKIIVQLQIILYLSGQHSKYKIEENQFSKKLQILKIQPFKKLLQFVVKKKKNKESRQLRMTVLKTKFQLNSQQQIEYKFIPTIQLCKQLRTYETFELVSQNSYSSQILNQFANDSIIHKGNMIYVKWSMKIINCIQDKLTDDENQIPLLQNFHQILKFLKLIFQNKDKKLISKESQMKIIEEKNQNNSFQTIKYFCKVFDIFSKYISRNSLQLTQRALTINQHLSSNFIEHILKYFLEIMNINEISHQKWFQQTLQSIFTFMAHIFYRRQFQNITGYETDISKNLRLIMIKTQNFPIKWRRLRNTKVVIDRWAQTVPEESQDFKIIIRKFLTSYFHKDIIISSKSTSTVFNPIFITRAYSNLFSAQLLEFIVKFRKDLQKFNEKQIQNNEEVQQADSVMSKIILFLSSRVRISSIKVSEVLIEIYKKFAHIVPSIYTFRAWLLMGKQGIVSSETNIDLLLSQIIKIHQFIPKQIQKISPLELISKVPLKEQFNHHINIYKKACKKVINELQFKLKNDVYGYERFKTIFKIIETQITLMQKLQNKIIQYMKNQKQKVGNILVENSLTSAQSTFEIIETIYSDFKMVIRYYICNSQKVLNTQDQADLMKVITQWLAKETQNKNIRAIIQVNQMLAYSSPAVNSHLSKKQVLGALRNLNGNDQLNLNQPQFIPFNMVVSFHQNIYPSFKNLLKFLVNHKKYAEQPSFIQNETNTLIKMMKNIDKLEQLNLNIQSGNCRLMIKNIIFPMTNYGCACIFNGKNQQKGKQQMVFGVYISQIQTVFSLNVNQIISLNFRQNLKSLLSVLKNKISRIVQVKNNRIQGRYRNNRERRSFAEATQQLLRLNIPQELIELSLQNVQIPDPQLALQWIQNNQGRLDQILLERILKKSKQQKKMVKQPSIRQKQKGFFIEMLSFVSFKEKIQKDMKNLIRKLAEQLFSQKGQEIRILLFILLDSFQSEQFKNKNYKRFSEKMFKQINAISLQNQIDSRKLNLIIAVLAQNISLCPSIMVDSYGSGINLKLLSLIPKINEADADKVFQLLSNLLPTFKQNDKIQESVILYLDYMLDVINKSKSDSSHISTILYKIILSSNQKLKKKVLKIFKNQLIKGVFKKKASLKNQQIKGIFTISAKQKQQITIFSSILLLFESDQKFSKANMELQLKGFIIQNYKDQILKIQQSKKEQKAKKTNIQIDIRKFSISFQRFDKNKRFNQVCHKFLNKKKNKKQFFYFNTQKHKLFQSQILGESYLSYNHKADQKVIIDCLIDLLVSAQNQQQQQIYLLQVYKLLEYYKLLIPVVLQKDISGNNICQWIIQKCLIKNRKKYDFLQFLGLNNNLYKNINQPFSMYTCSLILKSFKNICQNNKFKNETKFILMYLLQLNRLSKLCFTKFSKKDNLSLKQILQKMLIKSSQQQISNPIEYLLLSQSVSILQKRKLIDNLKSKYQIISDSTQSITQSQFLQLNLLYRVQLNEDDEVNTSRKRREGGQAYMSNMIGIGSQSRLIVDQMDQDQQNQMEQGEADHMNLRELLRMRLAPRDQNSGRNEQPLFLPIQTQITQVQQPNQVQQINQSSSIQQRIISNIQSEHLQERNLREGRMDLQQKLIREDIRKQAQIMQVMQIQSKPQQICSYIEDILQKFSQLIKVEIKQQKIQEEFQDQNIDFCNVPKQNTKITLTTNCSLNVVDPKQKLQNSNFKKILMFQKRFVSLLATIDPKCKSSFQIKRQADSSLGRRLADRLLLNGDISNRQQMINHIERLINQRVQEEQVERVRPMNVNQIIVGLQQQIDPPIPVQKIDPPIPIQKIDPPIQKKVQQVEQISLKQVPQKQKENDKKEQIQNEKNQLKEQQNEKNIEAIELLKEQNKMQQEMKQKIQQKGQQRQDIKQSQNVDIKQESKKQINKMDIQQSENKQSLINSAQIKPQKISQLQIQKKEEEKPAQQINQVINQNQRQNVLLSQNNVVQAAEQIVQNSPFRQILVMFNLPQTFLVDNGIDAQLFDQLPEEYQIDQITHYMGLAQQNAANVNNQNNPPPVQQVNNNQLNNNNQQNQNQRDPQNDIINENIALFASMDPQTRAEMLADYPPQFLLTLPVQMRTQVQQYRQRQIGRMLQQQQRQQMQNYQNQRIDPAQRANQKRNKKLKYPTLNKTDFNKIQQKTAESLAKCLFLKIGKLRTHQGFRVLLQNKWTQDKALATLIILLKEKDRYQITQGQYDSEKDSWKFERVLIQGYQMKRFKGKLLALIYETIKNKSYKDQQFLNQKIPFANYLGYNLEQEIIQKHLEADKDGFYPLYELLQVSIDIHPQLSVQLIKKCKQLPKILIQKIVESIKCDNLVPEFYKNLQFLSENQYIKQLFQKQFTEQKPPKIQNFARLLKYKFSKVPYLKKMHENALTNFTPAYYQFLNQIFSIYSIQDIKQIEELLIKHKHVHFQIIKQLYAENRSLEKEPMGIILKMPHLLDFQTKKYLFRKHPKIRKTARYRLPIEVDRTNIFQESYNQIMSKTPRQLEGRLQISFRDQQGYDAGGLTRQWLMCLSRQIFNPDYALFQPSSSGNTYQPNPKSYINPDHLLYFKFIGRFVGKALADNELVDAYFTRAFYKMILGQQIQFSDLQQQDYPFYKSMIWLKQNQIQEGEYTFSYLYDNFGNRIVKDLISNGRNMPVTEQNKNEYIQKYCLAKMRDDFKVQVQKFLEGFHEIIPHQCISFFQAKQLQLLISGLPQIDFEDLKKNVDYSNYLPTDAIIGWFWEIVQEYSQQDLARLIQFITGTSKIPVDGFANLKGMNGPQRISIHKDPVIHQLPKAHTCFNQLDLPNYPTKELLKQRLRTAITWGSEGFGFM